MKEVASANVIHVFVDKLFVIDWVVCMYECVVRV